MTPMLPQTTTARLLAVADLIAHDPQRWEQSRWITVGGRNSSPTAVQGHGQCGTVACIAGHAVMLTPEDQELPDQWTAAGRAALGLAPDLAQAIFAGSYRPADVASVLRLIAGIPEPGRTLRAAIGAGLRDLRGADLTDANLADANLAGANLTDADLRYANLTGVDLTGADLSCAFLTGANLTRADLYGANLDGADLTDAILRGANLDGASLWHAILTGAILTGAILTDANLAGANLTDAILTDDQENLT